MGKHIRILVLNGGGVRGIITAKILQKLVHDSNKTIDKLFDYVVGTSIGGIAATSLTVKDKDGALVHNADILVDMLINNAKKIFPELSSSYYCNLLASASSLYWSLNLFTNINSYCKSFYELEQGWMSAKYSRDGIDSLLYKNLGNATFKDTAIPVTTVSYLMNTESPYIFSSLSPIFYNGSYHYDLLRNAAGATSAAPTYFPPKEILLVNGMRNIHADGGIYANSPAILGIAEVFKNNPWIEKRDITVFTIGTGDFNKTDDCFVDKTDNLSSILRSTLKYSLSCFAYLFSCKVCSGTAGAFYIGADFGLKSEHLKLDFLSLLLNIPIFGYYFLAPNYLQSFASIAVGFIVGAAIGNKHYNFILDQAANGLSHIMNLLGKDMSILEDLVNMVLKNNGKIGWLVHHDITSKVMEAAQDIDMISASSLFQSITINPKLENVFKDMDKADLEHMLNFSYRIDKFIAEYDTLEEKSLWKSILDCLNSETAESIQCDNAKLRTKEFQGAYKNDFAGIIEDINQL